MNDCTFPGDTMTPDPMTDPMNDLMSDLTGSGMSMTVDLDGDGYQETIVSDLDGNGTTDVYDYLDVSTGQQIVALDSDLDGLLDVVVTDDDGDGTYDSVLVDEDGDGAFELELDPTTGEEITPPFETPALDEPTMIDPSTIDPAAVVDDDVHGDPMADIPYHQAQVSDNDCLPTSVAMVATEILGVHVPQGDLVALADEHGFLGPDGMTLDGGVTLLEHYGLEAELRTGTMDDLRSLLDSDTQIIIGLDADDLYGVGDQPFADDFVMGHAVVITGIDDEAGLVYINDPGFPDGAGVAVPIEDFEDAWRDGGNSLIAVEGPDADETSAEPTVNDTSDETAGETGAAAAAAAAAGGQVRPDDLSWVDLVLLPLRLIVP